MESTSSVMRKAVGPMRVHTHLSHSGPPSHIPSVWERTQRGRFRFKASSIKQKKRWNTQNVSKQRSIRRYEQTVLIYCHQGLKYSYAFHLSFAHDEGRAWPNAVGTVGDGARERLARLHQGSGHLRLQEVLLDTTWVRKGNNENNAFKNKRSTHQHTWIFGTPLEKGQSDVNLCFYWCSTWFHIFLMRSG